MATFTARFEPEAEAKFQAEYTARAIPFIRVSLPIAVTLYLLFLFWDYSIDPTLLGRTLIVRIAFCFVALAVFGLTYHRSFSRWAQPILCGTVILGALGVFLVLYILPDGFTYGTSGVLLVIMYTCGFLRLLFRPAVVACASFIVIGNVTMFAQGNDAFVYVNTNFFLVSAAVIGLSYSALLEWMERRAFRFKIALKAEKKISDAIVRNFLPDRIADRIKDGERSIAEAVGEATILFADMVGFTQLTKRLSPGHLVEILGEIFTRLDAIAEEKGIEKVKTIGDNYMAVSGVRNASSTSAEAMAEFAIEALNAIDSYAKEADLPLKIRIGIATGAVVSGVIGTKVPIFDLWGETVNLASRLESEGIEGAIQVSEATYWRLHQDYEFEERGPLQLKGGLTENAYILTGRKLIVTPLPQAHETAEAKHETPGRLREVK